MRNLIGFKKLQEVMGLQMVEGLGGWNQLWIYGGECGFGEGFGVVFISDVFNFISWFSGVLLLYECSYCEWGQMF